MQTVALIGAGLIGRAWALVFARAGWQVRIYDPNSDLLTHLPEQLLADSQILARHKLADGLEAKLPAIHITGDLADCVREVDFVQENGPEKLAVKKQIFTELDQLVPSDVPIASSTSALITSAFAQDLPGRERCFVGHPVNPPHLVPLVEISGAEWTKKHILEQAYTIYQSANQVPVHVHKEIGGFVLNRLQGALLAEALRLVGDGVISVEDLDKTVKDGLGLRWAFMGPFETIELNAPEGAEDYFNRYSGIFAEMASQPAGPSVFSQEFTQKIVAGWPDRLAADAVADRAKWRNERLAALVRHKQTAIKK